MITACRLYQHMEFREAFLSILLVIQGLPRHDREIVDVACYVYLNLLEGKSPNFGWLSIGLSSRCRDGTLRALSGLHAL